MRKPYQVLIAFHPDDTIGMCAYFYDEKGVPDPYPEPLNSELDPKAALKIEAVLGKALAGMRERAVLEKTRSELSEVRELLEITEQELAANKAINQKLQIRLLGLDNAPAAD